MSTKINVNFFKRVSKVHRFSTKNLTIKIDRTNNKMRINLKRNDRSLKSLNIKIEIMKVVSPFFHEKPEAKI